MSFSLAERKLLLAVKGVGPTVIARLEQLGYGSFPQLASAQASAIVEGAAALLGSSCWKNSPQARSAIEAAIGVARRHDRSIAAPSPAPTARQYAAPASAEETTELSELANLGPKSAAVLAGAGVQSVAHLRRLGAVAAYALAKRSGANVSLNLLWALEGALTGVPWQIVAREHRTSLLLALDTFERGGDAACAGA